MSSHNENEAWKEAQSAEDRTFRATKSSRRKAPFYKVMTGMPVAVDAFRYGSIPGVTAYFLTHAHSDHYTNLSSSWKAGPIYCSEGTANLIIHMLSVDRKWVHPLPMDVPTVIPNTGGVTVTLIEANHCPGSSLFFFEGKQTVDAGDSAFKSPFVGTTRTFRYLHCGDFRASPQHVLHPAVKGKKIDTIYLDTTYLNPKYLFPSQPQVISACAELAQKLVAGEHVSLSGGEKGIARTMDTFFSASLIFPSTYSIGKERIVKAVAKALDTKVYCDSRKAAILRCQEDPELHAMLTKDPYSAGVHLVPLSVITSDRIKEYMDQWKNHWDKIIGFRPTGWTYTPPVGNETLPSVASIVAKQPHREFGHTHLRPMRNSTPTHRLFGVPYSEHSSFYELTCFSLSLEWSRIIATVNVGSESSRGKIAAWVAKWEAERKRRGGGIVPYRSPEYW
ncbi:DRMBL-domain-containing protein [Peniophora sp. CONT]|nr:DRMBL-domain-containing protein [Peniophora sp. CONT]